MINFVKNNVKILTIIFFVIFFFNTTVLATDINMNLPVEEESSDTNTTDSNGSDTDVTDDSTANGDESNVDETTESTMQDDIGGTAAPSEVSSIAQENMSFSNILNILVITVGVILILLAIAILIRLKG